MRFKSDVENKDRVFHTDLNGFQVGCSTAAALSGHTHAHTPTWSGRERDGRRKREPLTRYRAIDKSTDFTRQVEVLLFNRLRLGVCMQYGVDRSLKCASSPSPPLPSPYLPSNQLIRRKTQDKLPLQGNFYPIPSLAQIEDERVRLSLHTAQPLGGASLKQGVRTCGCVRVCNMLPPSSQCTPP